MAFWDDAKNKMKQAMRPKQQEDTPVFSNRADGGFSGYVPKIKREQPEVQSTGYQQSRPAGMEGMMPVGVDPSVMQGFRPVGGQTGQMPPQQPMQGMPQGFTARQPMGAAQPMMNQQPMQAQPMQQPMNQATRPGFGAPAFQQNQPPMGAAQPMGQPMQQGFTNKQPMMNQQPMPQQPMQQPMPQQGFTGKVQQNPEHQTFAFPGESFMVDGHAYKMVFRVAQITGVPSCFRVIEFMYNNEAVIVNAEQITDLVEADRCMDLIFGAACAMKQRLMRVSGKQIYLITPPQVYVAPFEPLRRAGMADIDRRWPGAMQSGMQPQQQPQQAPFVQSVQPMQGMPWQQPAPQPMQQPMAAGQQTMQQPRPFARQDDFAGNGGRRASRTAMQNGYTDYGGFGLKSR